MPVCFFLCVTLCLVGHCAVSSAHSRRVTGKICRITERKTPMCTAFLHLWPLMNKIQ